MPTDTLENLLIKASLFLERYDSATQKEIQTKLLLAQDKIIALVSSTKNKATIRKELNAIFNEAFSTFTTVLADDIENIVELSWNATGVIMSSFVADQTYKKWKDVDKAIKQRILNENALYQGHTLNDHFSHLDRTTNRKIRGIIYKGFDEGQGIDQINTEIRNAIGGVNRNQSRTLVRTVLLENSEKAQTELFETQFKDEIIGYRYNASIDNRTTPYCLNAHNYFTTDLSKAKYRPKSHYSCRSIWTPETELSREIDKQAKQNLVEWDSRKVNHRDNTTSTKFTVDKVKKIPANAKGLDIFNYFDEAYKKEYLGATRYKLYKDGKADLKDMINVSRNKFIPLEQLERKLNL